MKNSPVIYTLSFAIEAVAWLILWHGKEKDGEPLWVRWSVVAAIALGDAFMLQKGLDINMKLLISMGLYLTAGHLLYRTSWMQSGFRTFLYAGFIVMGDVFGALASGHILGIASLHQVFTASTGQKMIWMIFSKGLLILLCFIADRKITDTSFLNKENQGALLPLALLSTNLLLVIGIFQFLFTYAVEQDAKTLLWILLPIFLSQALLFYLLSYMSQQQKKIKDIEIQAALSKEKEAYNLQQLADYETWSVLAHDMAKHQQALEEFQNMVENYGEDAALRRETGQLQSYILGLQEGMRQLPKIVQTGLFSLDMLLTAKVRECQAKGIRMEIALWGGGLSVLSPWDCNTLFANLLDNAVEGCESSDVPVPWITLRGDIRGGRYVCYIQNSCKYWDKNTNMEEGELPQTTKADKVRHGYGLKSIVNIIESYGGSISLEAKGDVFTVLFHLPFEKEKKER